LWTATDKTVKAAKKRNRYGPPISYVRISHRLGPEYVYALMFESNAI